MTRPVGRLAAACCGFLATAAAADQCQVLSRGQVERAATRVLPGDELLLFCEPCGETEPEPLIVRQVEAVRWEPADADLWELGVNGRAIDAAYTFVAEGGLWRNLATLIGCPADGVSQQLAGPRPRAQGASGVPTRLLVVDILHRAYDGSGFGRRWRATKEVVLRQRPADDAPEAARLAPGEWVTASAVESHVTPVEVAVVYDHGRFRAGDHFAVLDGLGEGFFRVWHRGEVVTEELSGLDVLRPVRHGGGCPEPSPECWGEAPAPPAERWWARVVTGDGREGWVDDPLPRFDGVLLGS